MPRGVYKRKPPMNDKILSEDDEQTRLAAYLSKKNILFYAIPNGGRRDMLEAIKLKRTGVRSGVPDICIPIARGAYHGLYIELKRVKGGVLSDNQQFWLEALFAEGYFSQVCKGAVEAIELVEKYLAMGGGNNGKPVLYGKGDNDFNGELPVF
jgi:hypothetical protein